MDLLQAVEEDDLPTVRWILQQPGVDVNALIVLRDNVTRMTALHFAAIKGHLAIVRALLQASDVAVDARDSLGLTPLHRATAVAEDYSRWLPIVQALLEAGADPNAVHPDGGTPLLAAIYCKTNTSIIEALLNGGANPELEGGGRYTPLHAACYVGRLDAVRALTRRQGGGPQLESLLTANVGEVTPLDVLQHHQGEHGRETVGCIRKFLLQSYAGVLIQRHGPLCLHSILQDVTFIPEGNEDLIAELPIGKLTSEDLQILVEYLIADEPGSIRALDRNGLLPVQVASQLHLLPDLVIYVLLRPYPDALF